MHRAFPRNHNDDQRPTVLRVVSKPMGRVPQALVLANDLRGPTVRSLAHLARSVARPAPSGA